MRQKVLKSLELFSHLKSICYIIALECYIGIATKHILCRTVLGQRLLKDKLGS